MANVSVLNMEGKEVGSMELNDAVFGVEINEHLVHQAVVLQLANNRQGTQKAKTRSEVSGGGRKPWRQKGTGHARQGSTRAPQWTGGGVVFAPVPRDYSFKMNKKEKRAALKSVLTSKVQENKFIVLDDIKLMLVTNIGDLGDQPLGIGAVGEKNLAFHLVAYPSQILVAEHYAIFFDERGLPPT
jgi:large subunit ribosomal protein L4